MGIKKCCFCMMNWKSGKSKQQSYEATPIGRTSQYSTPTHKSRGNFNTMTAADHTDQISHGEADNHGGNDAGAAAAAIIAIGHMHGMDGGGGE